MNKKSFLHFGCWNNGRCEKDNPNNNIPLTNIMRKLNKVSQEINPEFISVAGDNYYPNKIKTDKIDPITGENIKKQILNIEDLNSGFACLPKNIPIYVIMGNHDYETDLYINDKIETSCQIIETEKKITNKLNNNNYNIHLNIYNSLIFGENTLVLMIDTTLYDKKITESFKCYNKLIEISSIQEMITNQKQYIEQQIREKMTNNIKNIVIIGHHPILYQKIKNNKLVFPSLGEGVIDLFMESIYKKVIEKTNYPIKYYYLSSDLHQYQNGTIQITDKYNTINIEQYIVGTGGANLDPDIKELYQVNTPYKIKKNKYDITYNLNEEQRNNIQSVNGFLQCEENNNDGNLYFKFINTNLNSLGGKRKKIKTKQKTKNITKRNKYKKTKKNRKRFK
jgi:hypothetical protein